MVVIDPDIPHMGSSADVDCCADCFDYTFASRTDMVGIDLEAYANVFGTVDDQVRGDAAHRLCKYYRGSTVQDSKRLPHFVRDGHGGNQCILSYLDSLYTKILSHVSIKYLVDLC